MSNISHHGWPVTSDGMSDLTPIQTSCADTCIQASWRSGANGDPKDSQVEGSLCLIDMHENKAYKMLEPAVEDMAGLPQSGNFSLSNKRTILNTSKRRWYARRLEIPLRQRLCVAIRGSHIFGKNGKTSINLI